MIRIDSALCELSGTCVGVCPADAIVIEMNSIRIEEDRCISCESCVQVCPVGAVAVVAVVGKVSENSNR